MRRLDFKNTHEHQGTVKRGGVEFTKCFSDSRNGGFEGSKQTARKWELENGKKVKTKRIKVRKPIKPINTGERGITLRKKLNRSGNYSSVLQVHWSRDGKRYYAERSLDLHTYDGAMRELKRLRNQNHKPKTKGE